MKFEEMINRVICGDCLEVMKNIPDNSIDCIVTDPPYGISFMGKDWDKFNEVKNIQQEFKDTVYAKKGFKFLPRNKPVCMLEFFIPIWKECYRVLKPGSFAFIMCSPRQDVLCKQIIALENAGFQTRFTSIYWAYACLSEDTKILTENGLKGMNEVTNEDIVYSLNIKTNELVKSKVKNVFIYPFEGKLFNLKNQNTDQLITLNHKVLCKNKYHSGRKNWWEKEWKYVEAKDLKKHCALKIPISGIYRGNKRIGKDLANLLGWILSEGEFDKEFSGIRIYQSSVNQNNVNEIRNLLIKLKIPYKEYNRIRRYKNRNYTEFCFYFSGEWAKKIRKIIPNKQPTRRLLELIYNERLALYNTLIKGDGSRNKQNKNYKVYTDCFYQNNEKFLDWFEMLVLSLGWQTKRNRNKRCISIKKQPDTEFQWINYHPKLVNYKGKVWCIETEMGNFIAWRNERYFITGNSGFPKSANVSLLIDKKECKKQLTEKLGRNPTKEEFKKAWEGFKERGDRNPNSRENCDKSNTVYESGTVGKTAYFTKPSTPEAKMLDGSFAGFQPKPAVEVVLVAMKPLSEKSYVEQALKNKHGISWLSDCRIPYKNENDKSQATPQGKCTSKEISVIGAEPDAGRNLERIGFNRPEQIGRFPANLLVSDDVFSIKRDKGTKPHPVKSNIEKYDGWGSITKKQGEVVNYGDSGSFSRYFSLDAWWDKRFEKLPESVRKTFPFMIVPKASRNEKEKGLENFKEQKCRGNYQDSSQFGLLEKIQNSPRPKAKNFHPTVKPLKLFSYLITLGSRENDIVLDPFVGSGTTAISAKLLNRNFIGIEINPEYANIARKRLSAHSENLESFF